LPSISEVRALERTASADRVLSVLRQRCVLNSDEERQLRLAIRLADRYPAGAQVFGGETRKIGLIVSGWACEASILLDGRRQIFSILLPGDIVFPQPPGGRCVHTLMALTGIGVADITNEVGDMGCDSNLSAAVTHSMNDREERLLNQIVRLGRLSAYERVVHLLLEMRDRLTASDQVVNDCFPMPLTQEVLADALGLSMVHLNRTLQQLRRDKLIEFKAGSVTLLRPRALSVIADRERHSEYRPTQADGPFAY
jgi:CRP-like cAMP-binding protein